MNKIGLASLLDFEVSHTQTTAGFARPDKPILYGMWELDLI